MFVNLVAILILARAAVGELPASQRPAPVGVLPLTNAQLKLLKTELARWKLDGLARSTAEWLWQSELLKLDSATKLMRLTPAAYSWLQQPDSQPPNLKATGQTQPSLVGWLRWQADAFCFDFDGPVSTQPLTYDAWQLFHLMCVCDTVAFDEVQATYRLRPSLLRLNQVRSQGIGPAMLLEYLTAGLAELLPAPNLATFKECIRKPNRLLARPVVLVDAADRQSMQPVVADYRLRKHLTQLLSPRLAAISPKELGLFRRLLERRGIFLQLSPDLTTKAGPPTKLELKLTRSHLQLIMTGLLLLRGQQVASGYTTPELDVLLAALEARFTSREIHEVQHILEQFGGSAVSETGPSDQPSESVSAAVRQRLLAAIESQTELLVEYTRPGQPPQLRRIEPLQLYQENNQAYLIAYCHLRQGQRTFRLDRLRLHE